MVKVKSDRYKLVKAMRPLMQRVLLRGRSFNKSGDIADLARRIIDYAHEHHIDLAYERRARYRYDQGQRHRGPRAVTAEF